MVRQSRGPFGASGETAKRRLKLLLVSDKAGCSPEMIRLIREDMIHAISKYMDIEKERVQLLMDGPTGNGPGWACCTPIYLSAPLRARGFFDVFRL